LRRADRETFEKARLIRARSIDFIRRYYHPDLDNPERTFGETGEDWQYRHFIEPFFNPRIERVYIECPRDWDKTGLIGACAVARCLFDPGCQISVYAADREQAGIMLESVARRILAHHPEFRTRKEIVMRNNRLLFSNGSMIRDEASEAAGAIGKPRDMVITDELHCWNKQTDLMLWSSFATKMRTKIIVTTNPGARRSGLCWDVREQMREKFYRGDRNVYFYSAEGEPFLPSWLNEWEVRYRSTVPQAVFRRFHLCKWGEGGDVFTEEQIAACQSDIRYVDTLDAANAVFGLDFGFKRDWSALVGCIGGPDGITMIHKKIWCGSQQNPVSISDIESYIHGIMERFNVRRLLIERPEMISTIERLKSCYGDIIEEWVPSEKAVVEISQNIYQLVSENRFFFPADDAEFAAEMRDAEVLAASGRGGTTKSDFKIRFNRTSDARGHGDVFRAMSIAAWRCVQSWSRDIGEILAGIRVASNTAVHGETERSIVGSVGEEMFLSNDDGRQILVYAGETL